MFNSSTFIIFLKGFLMGVADLIPGVSGGTIAFITGIYDKLISTLATIDKDLIICALKLDFKSVAKRIDLKFIIPLGIGILTAVFTLARLMHFLISNHSVPTWGLFFGLILSSILVIFSKLESKKSLNNIGMIALGTLVGIFVTHLVPVTTPESSWFIFICGLIAITAMILPGISGSFLLLILGKYEYITGIVKNPFADGAMGVLVIFALGCLTGLISFSKILNYFMSKFRDRTMSFLIGILIGTLGKVWPWRAVTDSVVIRGKVRVLSEELFIPTSIGTADMISISLILIGFIVVQILEKRSKGSD